MIKSYIPGWIAEKEPIQSVLSSLGHDTGAAADAIKDTLAQCFVDTATWGLKYWEEYLGIPVNQNKPVGYRRSVVKSKLRGAGTTTADLIETIAESYQNGDVDIIEDPRQKKVQVRFNGIYGIPPNMEDFNAALDRIIPAHLFIEYLYSYLTWEQLDATAMTWAELDEMQMTWEQFETWNPDADV